MESKSGAPETARLRREAGFPAIVNVEVFRGACPCACRHCPVGLTERRDRAARFGLRGIDLGLYAKIVREVASQAAMVRIHSVGDPVLWPNLPAALELGRRHGVRSWIFTSAVTRDRELLKSICSRVDVVEVSVNSIESQDYLRTKGVDAYALVAANLRFMSQVRRPRQTRLIVSRTQTADQAADQAFIHHWNDTGLVDDAFVRSYHTYNDLLEPRGREEAATRHQPCLVHWARFNISVDGYAVVCFNELFRKRLDPRLILGDVNRQSIVAIWQGEPLKSLRRAELSGDYANLPFGEALPCRECLSCQPLGGGRPTSECQLERLAPPEMPALGEGGESEACPTHPREFEEGTWGGEGPVCRDR